jgi:uncharacterized membrane protein
MWYTHHGPWCFGFLFLFLIIGFFIFRVLAFRRFGGFRRGWHDDAESILRKRLVNGEIDEEEYLKLKAALKK